MQSRKSLKESLLFFLKGLLMGTADIIPGVSGGTMAFITGIYTRLIHSLSLLPRALKLLIQGRLEHSIKTIDFSLFIPLGLGIGIAILTLSKLITNLLDSYPAFMYAFFFGLIMASALHIAKQIKKIRFEHIVFATFGFILAYIIVQASTVYVTHTLPVIFFSGAVAISAMLLPGLSGAFILLLLNQYSYLLTALHSFNLPVVITFLAGALFGLMLFAKALDYILKKFPHLTLSLLVGVMVGALRIPYQSIVTTSANVWLVLLMAVVGFSVVLLIESSGK